MAIVVHNGFTFLHMPKTGGISTYKMLFEEESTLYPYHVPYDEVVEKEDLPIVIGSRGVDSWHLSYYNYVFKQMRPNSYHIHELFKQTPTFEEFTEFSYNKTCDYGPGLNNPNNQYGGFKYVTTLMEDWWEYDGNLYDYIRDHLLCGNKPDYEIRQEFFMDDWLSAYSDMGLLTDKAERMILGAGRYNRGAF